MVVGMLLNWLVSAIVIFAAAYVLPGIHVRDFTTAFVVAVILGLCNVFLKPILVLLTLPITIVTLGLFILVINALLILLVARVVPGFSVDGFWWALLFGIILSVLSLVFQNSEK